MRRWEVFNPRQGDPVYTTRSRLVARLVSWCRGLDYAPHGVGWLLLAVLVVGPSDLCLISVRGDTHHTTHERQLCHVQQPTDTPARRAATTPSHASTPSTPSANGPRLGARQGRHPASDLCLISVRHPP